MTLAILIVVQAISFVCAMYYTHKRIDSLAKKMNVLETGSLRKWVSEITEGIDESE